MKDEQLNAFHEEMTVLTDEQLEYMSKRVKENPPREHVLFASIDTDAAFQNKVKSYYEGDYSSQEELVYQIIKNSNGLTDREICERIWAYGFQIEKSSETARRRKLVQKGLVIAAGSKEGKTGKQNTVWKANA